MQEIALLLSSLAGVATAAAVRKIPRGRPQLLSLGASSHIKSQINSLRVEKDLLAKTISRLYQADAEYSKIRRDKLLSKYQHQMGIVLAKLEKLEQSSRHPDLGPVGDGLITLMDQKLSRLDDRLYELASRMAAANAATARGSKGEAEAADAAAGTAAKKPEMKQARKAAAAAAAATKTAFNFEKSGTVVGSPAKPRQSFELTTLTRLPGNRSESPPPMDRPGPEEEEKEKAVVVAARPQAASVLPGPRPEEKMVVVQPVPAAAGPEAASVLPGPRPEEKMEVVQPVPAAAGPGPSEMGGAAKKSAKKPIQRKALPGPEAAVGAGTAQPDDGLGYDPDDDDGDDLDRIKGDIKKVLSKIDQAEVE